MSVQRHNRAWWRTAISDFTSSGMSRLDFAVERGVHPDSIRLWQRQFEREAEQMPTEMAPLGTLLRVEIAEPVPEAAPPTFEATVGPAQLRIAVGTDPAYVGAVVAAIAQAVARC